MPTVLSICWKRAFRQHEEKEEGLKREPKRMWECDSRDEEAGKQGYSIRVATKKYEKHFDAGGMNAW